MVTRYFRWFASGGLPLSVLAGALLFGCSGDPAGGAAMTAQVPRGIWQVSFSDGSNNATAVSGRGEVATFTYRPMTPQRSSSGVYSGGEPRSGAVSRDEVARLWALVGRAEADRACRVAQRTMGSGLLRVTRDGAEEQRILLGRCELRQQLEALVKDLGQ